MNAFKNHTSTIAPVTAMAAHHVIANLASELQAAGEILTTFHHFSPMAPILHAMADLKARGVIDLDVLRKDERTAVLSMSKQFLAQRIEAAKHIHSDAVTEDLVRRLRTVAGQNTIKPPALDIEAANHIEYLALRIRELEAGRVQNPTAKDVQ